MRLSEAAVLGLMLVCEMEPQDINLCYLGLAGTAVGIPLQSAGAAICHRIEAIYDYWPWLAANNETRGQEIMELFDEEVCRRGRMTFQTLNDYIKTIEPACGQCNTFDCCCTRAEVTFEEALKDPSVWVT